MTDIYAETIFFVATPEPEEMQARLRAVEGRMRAYLKEEEDDVRRTD